MRDYILLFINSQQHRVSGDDAFLTLANFLRLRLKLCGTKVVCAEGDCGSCSVLCGRSDQDDFKYYTIDSCIQFVFQLDGCHIVTVEGVGTPDNPSAVQQAMVDCHGSQCGFCTPGFVVAMTDILEQYDKPDTEAWRHGLTGNLCRCTGYSPIITAGQQASEMETVSIATQYPPESMIEAIAKGRQQAVTITGVASEDSPQTIFCPTTLEQAVDFLADHPDARVVAGATDVGVQFNKGFCTDKIWLDLNRIDSLKQATIDGQQLVAGACATWATLEQLTETTVPEYHKIISIFGSPQIRNAGTIGGNIINASPISDSLPFLHVCDATLQLSGKSGQRTVNVNDFYSGYKKMDLQPGELLTGVIVPLPASQQRLKLYKVSRRLDMDISTFTAAILIELESNRAIAGKDDSIKTARIAFGAVGPVVLRLPKTESFLVGKPFTQETFREAGEISVQEVTPISDVRGDKEYRLQLAKNILLKFYYETSFEGAAV